MSKDNPQSVAAAYLALLADRGVDHLFGNAGTDFAPIIEAYASAARDGTPVPRPILATHENLAASMAHGYAMVTRKVPAVMVHVSVGTANIVCAAMNAARENVAMLLTAGRSPITEEGLPGARDFHIHWGQELFDQAGMLREIVKWDYELRNSVQLQTVVDRALAIARTEPCGPVYLTLPREVLAAPANSAPSSTRLHPAASVTPDATAIEAAAQLLAKARRPLVVTSNAGRDPTAFSALAAFAERFAIPVVQHYPRYISLPSSHPMHLGYNPTRLLKEVDLILALESDVPWIPTHGGPSADCKVIQCGLDPLYARIPIRGFPCDLGLTGPAAVILDTLAGALEGKIREAAIASRRKWVNATRAAFVGEWQAAREAAARSTPIHPAWLSHCLDHAKERHAIVVNEYSLQLEHCAFEQPDTYFGSSSASGLGWGAGAALGAKLAAPERPVIAVVGDGAYLFSNPVAVHHAAVMHELPVLFVVINNAMWNAVRRSALAMYPSGSAARSNAPPFTQLTNLPAFEAICAASGGYGERVEDPAALPMAFERALAVIKNERRHALLNVICSTG